MGWLSAIHDPSPYSGIKKRTKDVQTEVLWDERTREDTTAEVFGEYKVTVMVLL